MTGRMSMMNAIKRAVSPLRPSRTTATDAGSSSTEVASLTEFVLNRLQGPSKELFALSFAAQMSVDKHALVFDLADALPWLGIDRIDSALRLLTRNSKRASTKSKRHSTQRWKNQKADQASDI